MTVVIIDTAAGQGRTRQDWKVHCDRVHMIVSVFMILHFPMHIIFILFLHGRPFDEGAPWWEFRGKTVLSWPWKSVPLQSELL